MPKFSALSFSDLQSPERQRARLLRGVHFVVETETDDGSWCELDAEDSDHAKRLADNWVDVLGARGCSCWCVNAETGALARTSFYKKFEEACFND
jgi:hypothetical protein